MKWNHPHAIGRRATLGSWFIAFALGTIGIGFFRLQVMGRDRYLFQSDQNRIRPSILPAPRGLIVDRHGDILADNVPGYTVSLIGSSRDSLTSTMGLIADLIGLDASEVAAILDRPRARIDDPVVIMRDAPFDVVSALEERRVALPGLTIQAEPKRNYPHGDIFAHSLGYVNEITQQELERGSVAGARYGTLVGRSGLEREYDSILRGSDGRRHVEVDAFGRTVRQEGVLAPSPPVQGETVRTTLDLDLQSFVQSQFPADARGAVVAMDPRNGDILAMYSAPSFDPNAFVGGIEIDLWDQIRNSEDNPLLNRAVQGRYPPASPWKLAVATMALRRGIVTMDTQMTTPCHGGMAYFTRYFRCWRTEGHGSLTLAEAIQHSCDVYFYQLGLQIGLQNLLDDGTQLGFSRLTGVDLPNEVQSFFPATTSYYDQTYGPRGWTRAVTLNLAIGQGENDQTLLNMMRFYAALANDDGVAPTPRFVMNEPVEHRSASGLRLEPTQIDELREALVMVVEQGTAVRSRVANLRIAGKTGTAQNSHGPNHGWFIAFAPAEEPEIVVGAIVEFAEHGSDVAPIVTNVIARHLFGADETRDRSIRLVVPADSAPQPLPLADSVLIGG